MLSRTGETLEGVYLRHPGVAQQIVAQERWEGARSRVLEGYYNTYTLSSLFRLIVAEVVELMVDAIARQPRELALLEAGDVHAITCKLALHLSRVIHEPVNFEDWRPALEEIHVRATLNERVQYRSEFTNKERIDLEMTALGFVEQLIVSCSVLSGGYSRSTKRDAKKAMEWLRRFLDPKISPNTIVADAKTGDPQLSPWAERMLASALESMVPFLSQAQSKVVLDEPALLDVFSSLNGIDTFFPESDPNAIGTGYYLEGPVQYVEEGVFKVADRSGKNARHIRPNQEIKALKAQRKGYPLHMLPDERSPYGAKQQYLAQQCGERNPAAKIEYARSELPRRTPKMSGIEIVHVELR